MQIKHVFIKKNKTRKKNKNKKQTKTSNFIMVIFLQPLDDPHIIFLKQTKKNNFSLTFSPWSVLLL